MTWKQMNIRDIENKQYPTVGDKGRLTNLQFGAAQNLCVQINCKVCGDAALTE